MSFFKKIRSGKGGHVRSRVLPVLALCALIFSGDAIVHRVEGRDLIIGRVSIEPQRSIPRVEKIARYLALRTADLGITAGRAMVVPDDGEMRRLLATGAVDLFSETGVAAASYVDNSDADVLLHEWRDQVPYYHSLFVIRKGNDIRGLEDLVGRKVAFDRIGSTTAYVVPVSMLRKIGLNPVQIASFNEPVPVSKLGYVFSGRAVNTASWVARGVVDAGAVSDIDMKLDTEIPEGIKKELQILTASPPLPRSLLLVRRNLDSTLKKRIADILLAADRDADGKTMLREYFVVNRYTPFTGDVVDRFRDVRRLVHGDKL
jgi:phosphonate transport system substrate-binding protein